MGVRSEDAASPAFHSRFIFSPKNLWYARSACEAPVEVDPSTSRDITDLLRAWGEGDKSALEHLTPLVYDQLHRIARSHMAREYDAPSLQTTELINEVYLRLIDTKRVQWQDRAHFFAVSAQLMRRILIDFARSRGSQKRGGSIFKISLDEAPAICQEPASDLVVLDSALQALATFDERASKVVELKFFGGLNTEETAEVLQVSTQTVLRDWKFAKVWLLREISGEISLGE